MVKHWTNIPGESAIAGLGIPGYMIPGMSYLAPINNIIGIRVYDSSMSRVGELSLYTNLTITENWYTPDTWELNINRFLPNATTLVMGGYMSVVQDTMLISSIAPFVGMVERFEPKMDTGGRATEMWTFGGRCAKGGKLKKRRCMNHFSDAATGGYFIQSSVTYGAAMLALINENAVVALGPDGLADTNRDIAGLTIGTGALLGATATALTTRGDRLLDVLETWSKASGLNCSLDWSGTGNNFVVNVNEGTDRSGTGSAKQVILSVDYRNVMAYNYLYSILDSADTLYCAGSGDDDARLLELVYDTTEPTGESRNEEFLDLSDCTTADQLTTKGAEQLIQYAPVQSLTFDYDPTSTTYVLDRDFFCGDTIVVDFPGVATLTGRIITVTKNWDNKGVYNVQITIGNDWPDLVSIVKRLRYDTSSIRRH